MNTGNYILNKYLIEHLKLINKDKYLIENSSACDVIFLNTLLFEQLNLTMHVVPNLHYSHVVHNESIWIQTHNKTKKYIDIINNRYHTLIK